VKIRMTQDWDYRWPSGAVTAFKKGWSGKVKKEVGAAALAAQAAEEVSDSGEDSPAPEAETSQSENIPSYPDNAEGPLLLTDKQAVGDSL